MAQNLVSGRLTPEEIIQIKDALLTVKTKMPFLLSLTDKEKRKLLKLGDHFEPFVKDGCEIVDKYPSIFPGTFNKEEYKSDYELYSAIKPIVSLTNEILKAIEDTMMAAGSDALMTTMEVYGFVQSNVDKIPGLQETANRMEAYFPRKSKKLNQETPVE